jgi:hypothetical protein
MFPTAKGRNIAEGRNEKKKDKFTNVLLFQHSSPFNPLNK